MLGDVGLMMALFVAKRIALKTKGDTRNTRAIYNLRLRSPCERKKLPKAAPNRQRADECPAGGSVFGTKEINSWRAPLAQKGSALWALFWAPYGLFFHWGPGLGATWRGQDFRPSLFFFTFPSGCGASIPAFTVVSARDDGPAAGPAASGAEGPGTGHLRWGEGGPRPAPQTYRRRS